MPHNKDIAAILKLKESVKRGDVGRDKDVVVKGVRALVRQMSELSEINLRLDDIITNQAR
jgi:hypothetical protein